MVSKNMTPIVRRFEDLRLTLDQTPPGTDEEGRNRFASLTNACLKELGMTQADLAHYVDVSPATVSRWLDAKSCPHVSQQKRVFSILKRRLSRQITKERHRHALEVAMAGTEKVAAAAG